MIIKYKLHTLITPTSTNASTIETKIKNQIIVLKKMCSRRNHLKSVDSKI